MWHLNSPKITSDLEYWLQLCTDQIELLTRDKYFAQSLSEAENVKWISGKSKVQNRPGKRKRIPFNDKKFPAERIRGYWFVKCKKCSATVPPNRKKRHCRQHLKLSRKLTHPFNCLCCKPNHPFKTKRFLRNHLKKVHNIINGKLDVHYTKEETNKYDELLASMMDQCFSNAVTVRKFYKERSYVSFYKKLTCQKCNKTIPNTKFTKECHANVHVKREGNFEWFYKCLKCDSFSTLYKRSINIHSAHVHKNRYPKVGKDYLDKKEEVEKCLKDTVDQCFKNSTPFLDDKNQKIKSSALRKFDTEPDPNSVISVKREENGKKKVLYDKQGTVLQKKCNKCGISVKYRLCHMESHVFTHLKRTGKIQWLFYCLLCEKKKMFKTLYLDQFKHHFTSVHGKNMDQCENNLHYLDKRERSKSFIEKETYECFRVKKIENNKKVSIIKKTNERYTSEKVSCKLCDVLVTNFKSRMSKHASSHIKSETQLDWLFKCLKCTGDATYKGFTYDAVWNHLRHVHHEPKPKLNIHYLDVSNDKANIKIVLNVIKMCFPNYK